MVDPNLSVELSRLESARAEIPHVVDRYVDVATRLTQDLRHSANPHQLVAEAATSLWEEACVDIRSKTFDDRSLYWGRLLLHKTLADHDLDEFSPTIERLSRNLGPHPSSSQPQAIITGFDPFGLDMNLQQCNPSGAFALALNGQKFSNLHVKTMIFPVRYADFDDFCVENTLEPVFKLDSTVLVLTVSMGRERFDLERFPAKCRGAKRPDNQDVNVTQTTDPFDPPLDGPSFLEFSLPVDEMFSKMSSDTRSRISDNRLVTTVEDGAIEASSLDALEGKHALSGSGGNFLSNEVSYRALNLQSKLGTKIPMGHVHVPRIAGYNENQVRQDFAAFEEIVSVLASIVPLS
ncbi:MAG: hypothetical protein OXG25_11085 [Gammaproteobacteria bacterium]|nr:hypothetical protein [Gammaproteobacteria bacterium]